MQRVETKAEGRTACEKKVGKAGKGRSEQAGERES